MVYSLHPIIGLPLVAILLARNGLSKEIKSLWLGCFSISSPIAKETMFGSTDSPTSQCTKLTQEPSLQLPSLEKALLVVSLEMAKGDKSQSPYLYHWKQVQEQGHLLLYYQLLYEDVNLMSLFSFSPHNLGFIERGLLKASLHPNQIFGKVLKVSVFIQWFR